ncbi:hypothetical protein SmJEL517_g05042 [Synchytrium microbalum]|uniref:Ubiquitin-like domain-containing protein n=1 Tax=Synchytrium microbalum TaxID=1806994 RepID=A0A507BX03_9FUNG|nr:uncharacterized protein SmJEL517_g05042 [Synchytrium microbalum]TPX31678.1 hypothetical protein SmJEL517_g05042 [Synchytrium microbalum]
MHLTVKKRSGSALVEKLVLSKDEKSATVDDVCAAIHKQFPKYDPTRQRLTFGEKVVLERGNLLSKYSIKDGDTIVFKDLGLQVSWRTVFLAEYFGPIWIHPLFYFFPQIFYRGAPAPHSTIQSVTLILTVLHFLKREYETVFVHRFSAETMPIMNLPKNCTHYWLFSGLFLAYFTYQPGFNGGITKGVHSQVALYALIGLWAFSEVSNYLNHVTLMNLRPEGSKVRKIPHGYGFDLVSCPNYFFECLGWLAVSIINGSGASWLFTAISTYTMYNWAVKKHLRYKKEFGPAYPRSRKAMFPFIA